MQYYKNTLIMLGALTLASCSKTLTSTLKMQSKVTASTETISQTNQRTETVTKNYGDTLKGSSILFFSDSARVDSITAESAGIELKIRVTPQRNKAGTVTGNQVNYSAIAKPTQTITTHVAQLAEVRTTAKQDSTGRSEAKTQTKSGIGVPSWVWWLMGIGCLLILIYFIKPFIKL